MSASILRALQLIGAILRDMFNDDGPVIIKVVLVVITLFFALLIMILMPVVIHERIPVTITKSQALWYYDAAMEVTMKTQSPCDDGVYVDWQEVVAVDAVRYNQNFNKSSAAKALDLADRFVEETGTCTHCTGSGENQDCTSYPVYRLKTIEEVMDDLGMSEKKKKMVVEKYRVVDFNFLIGFKPEAGEAVGDYSALYSGEMYWPVPGHHDISSPFGLRKHPVYGDMRMHYGIDIPAPEGTVIEAPAAGRVSSYQWSDAVGWTMVIDHGVNEQGQRIKTRYCHLSASLVSAGDDVLPGEAIAKVGNTGYLTTGAHLHFEVHLDGVCQDPAAYFTVS